MQLDLQGSVLDLAHAHTSAPPFERAILELFERDIGCDVAFFAVRGDEARPSTLGFEPWMIERAAARTDHYACELLPVKQAALAAHGVAVDSEVLGAARMSKAAYFRELAAPIGGRHSLLAYLRWRGQVVAQVMLGRCTSSFSPTEIQRIEPGGALAVNVIGALWADPTLATTIANMRKVFADVRVLPVCTSNESFDPSALRNIVLVGSS